MKPTNMRLPGFFKPVLWHIILIISMLLLQSLEVNAQRQFKVCEDCTPIKAKLEKAELEIKILERKFVDTKVEYRRQQIIVGLFESHISKLEREVLDYCNITLVTYNLGKCQQSKALLDEFKGFFVKEEKSLRDLESQVRNVEDGLKWYKSLLDDHQILLAKCKRQSDPGACWRCENKVPVLDKKKQKRS